MDARKKSGLKGAGFAIKSHLVSKHSGLPKGINDRQMMLRLPLSGKRHATIVSAYAPTLTNPNEVKDKLYDDLDSVISAAPRTDKLILLRDFNARVGTGHQTWKGVIGTEGVGKCNSSGLLLLKKYTEHELLITNTVFHLPTRRKTGMHPRSKHRHLIDYVTVRRKDRQDVRVTKTVLQITGLLSTNSTCPFSLHVDHQAETRRQEPFRCTGTQFRRCRWELVSLQRYHSLFNNGFPRTSISQTSSFMLDVVIWIRKNWNSIDPAFQIRLWETHYENVPIQIYWKFQHQKQKVFR